MLESRLPACVGPAEFSEFCGMVAVRCPADLKPLINTRRAENGIRAYGGG
jgi:hypothetical protein